MPIFAASSGIVMPGCPCTKERACAARVPLPLRRPARRSPGGRPGFLRAEAFAVVLVVALARVREPFGPPGPRRRLVGPAEDDDPPPRGRAGAAGCGRLRSPAAG